MAASKKDEDMVENLKILATTIEALNQQIDGRGGASASVDMAPLEEKFHIVIDGLNLINNKVSKLSKDQADSRVALETKVDTYVRKYEQDMQKVHAALMRNEAILTLLKSTVEILEEVVDVLKESAGGGYDPIVPAAKTSNSSMQRGPQNSR
ncbi:hypothetical protein H6501_03405 [Candidatus Woesearchaeota archaeon]|nr:hypothetical protein [Nanoarchaeota archaeon]MCB9370616.1 hypothetical protein [Candidatus Woesearchaeota archaeon]USN43700.1 MAG: hypothetical protein H6500_04905 [Candidatus Woesearchaeota archaeon]